MVFISISGPNYHSYSETEQYTDGSTLVYPLRYKHRINAPMCIGGVT